jgi:transposase InsO family protein
MSSERRSTRSQSVGPSRLPRARRVDTFNTLSAPFAPDLNSDQQDTNQEGDLSNLNERVSELEANIKTIIETQLANALGKVMNEFSKREKIDESLKEVVVLEEEDKDMKDDGKRIDVKMPKVKIEPKLSGQKNYLHWKMMMMGQMIASNIVGAIEKKLDEEDRRNIYALDFITRSISGQMIPYILGTKNAHEAWKKLEDYCAPKNAGEVRRLRMELARMELRSDDKMDDYIGNAKRLKMEIANQGIIIDDVELITYLLSGLTEKYETIAQIIENSNLPFDDACSKLKSLAQKFNKTKSEDKEKALLLKKGKLKCYNCGKIGHTSKICKSETKCFKCNKTGHISKNCPPNEGYSKEKEKEVGLVSALAVGVRESVDGDWILDSAASSHICCIENKFVERSKCQKNLDQLESNRSVKAIGIGSVEVNGIMLKDVLHVPAANVNLISLNKLLKEGYEVKFDDQMARIYLDNDLKLTFIFKDGLYTFTNEYCYSAISNGADLNLWHRRFAHANKKMIKFMETKQIVEGLKIEGDVRLGVCSPCVVGKMKREKFDRKRQQVVQPLDVIHSDVCGPFQKSLGGKCYYVSFIDESSRYKWIYLMERRDQLFKMFVYFYTMIKNQFGKAIKAVRTDNGGEYTSDHMTEFLKQNGIIHERTVPYSPQMNGIAERFNRTLLDAVRSMLEESKLPKDYWGEAASTAVYVLNRSLTSVLKNRTPFEVLFGIKPNVTHLKVFGAKCWFKVSDQKRNKLDNKAEEGIFLGYISDSIFRVFNLKNGEVIRTREIVVAEDSFIAIENQLNDDDEEVIVSKDDDMEVTIHNDKLFIAWDGSPQSYLEAQEDTNNVHWNEAMQHEYNSLINNETWVLVPRPQGKNVISGKWVYATKRDESGNITRYKARWVARGFNQIKGVDYNEVFAPTARSTTIRILLSLIVSRNMNARQYDVETAYLNGIVKEEVYLEQPIGFEVGDKVCKLKKAIYGLKQAGREWNNIISKFFEEKKFCVSESDACLFFRWRKKCLTIVVLYVDDLIIASDLEQDFIDLEVELKREFKIQELGS